MVCCARTVAAVNARPTCSKVIRRGVEAPDHTAGVGVASYHPEPSMATDTWDGKGSVGDPGAAGGVSPVEVRGVAGAVAPEELVEKMVAVVAAVVGAGAAPGEAELLDKCMAAGNIVQSRGRRDGLPVSGFEPGLGEAGGGRAGADADAAENYRQELMIDSASPEVVARTENDQAVVHNMGSAVHGGYL